MTRSRYLAALALTACLAWYGALAAHAQTATLSERIEYSREDPLQFGDLIVPPGKGPFPLAVVIHGGCWRAETATLDSTSPLASALANAGVATWNVEYRRVGDEGGGWPGTFRDVAAAVDFAKSLAKTHHIDLARVVVVGHSAGAHLALWAASRAKLDAKSALWVKSPLALRGVVAIAGPGDLRPLGLRGSICGAGTIETLLGGTVESVPEHYAQASPAALLPLGVRQFLIAGSNDRVVPPRLVAQYEEAARKAGDSVALDLVEGANHMELIVPSASAWPVVRKRVLELAGVH